MIKIQVCFIIKKSNNQNPGLFDHLRSDDRRLPHRSLSRGSSRLRSGRRHFCKQVGNRQNGRDHFSIKVASVVFKTYLLTITIIAWAIIITILNIMITTVVVIITINQDVRTHGVDHSNLCRLLNIW